MGCHKQLQRKLILAAYLKGYLGLLGFICVALASVAGPGCLCFHVKKVCGRTQGVMTAFKTPHSSKMQVCKRGSWAVTINLCTWRCADKGGSCLENGISTGALSSCHLPRLIPAVKAVEMPKRICRVIWF